MHSRNLDLLRSCAVLCVALSHLYSYCGAWPQFRETVHNIGVGGVVFFFVHTSRVLFQSMERMEKKSLVWRFYVRRFFRIYPLCWFCIGFVLLTKLTDAKPDQLVGVKVVLANLLLVQNLARVPSVVGPLWSLPWEVQMYIVLPFLFMLVKRIDHILVPLGLWMFITVLAVSATATSTPRVFHALVFIPMFIGGMVAFQLRRSRSRFSWVGWPLVILGLIIGRAVFLRGDSTESPRNVAVNAATCLLLGLAIPLFRETTPRWIATLSHTMAEYSYGIYLFHVPLLVLCFEHLNGINKPVRTAVWILGTVTTSYICHRLLEMPGMQLGKRLSVNRSTTFEQGEMLVADERVDVEV
jgi:peptidoglycan/LPS O-acetylase OafA/YrhL